MIQQLGIHTKGLNLMTGLWSMKKMLPTQYRHFRLVLNYSYGFNELHQLQQPSLYFKACFLYPSLFELKDWAINVGVHFGSNIRQFFIGNIGEFVNICRCQCWQEDILSHQPCPH